MASRSGKVETAIYQAFGSNTFDALVAFGEKFRGNLSQRTEKKISSTDFFLLWCSCVSGAVQGLRSALNQFKPVPVLAKGVDRDGLVDIAILVVYCAALFVFRMRLTRIFGYFCLVTYCVWISATLYYSLTNQ